MFFIIYIHKLGERMDINTQNNISTIPSNNSSQTNLIERYKTNYNQQKEEQQDKIILNRDFIANLEFDKDKAAVGAFVKGQINNKPALLKVVSNTGNEGWYEGAVNKKYLLLHCKDKVYNGKYGSTEFNLTVDYNEPSKLELFFKQNLLGKIIRPDYFNVKGKIGDKVIDITLPNVKIPPDEETRDLLTMLLEDNGLKAQTINGEIKTIKLSYNAIKGIKEKAQRREKVINNDIKPIFMQGISTATGMVIGSIVSTMLFKFGIKR